MHRPTIGGHEGDAAVGAIEDDLVVAHVGGADDGAIVLVVKDAEAPDAASQLVGVLARAEGEDDAVAEMDGEGRQLEHLRGGHTVAVVVGVLALRNARRARAPRAVRAEVVADGAVGVGW